MFRSLLVHVMILSLVLLVVVQGRLESQPEGTVVTALHQLAARILAQESRPEVVEAVRRSDVLLSDTVTTRQKKSSVSWLLAAAIRMCHKFPNECLRHRQMGIMGPKRSP